jgi:hypothetical protein
MDALDTYHQFFFTMDKGFNWAVIYVDCATTCSRGLTLACTSALVVSITAARARTSTAV